MAGESTFRRDLSRRNDLSRCDAPRDQFRVFFCSLYFSKREARKNFERADKIRHLFFSRRRSYIFQISIHESYASRILEPLLFFDRKVILRLPLKFEYVGIFFLRFVSMRFRENRMEQFRYNFCGTRDACGSAKENGIGFREVSSSGTVHRPAPRLAWKRWIKIYRK